MRVHLGGDHAALDLKTLVAQRLRDLGHEPVDHGPPARDDDDDYPVYVLRAAAAVAGEPGSLGVVLGGSGNGECIAANKVRGVRCALVHSVETAVLARSHNDATVMALGARTTAAEVALEALEVFLSTSFTGVDRHARRLAMLTAYEADGKLPPLPAEPA